MSRRPTIILALLILTFTVAVSAVGFWKYAYYAYNGLDLAIYANVLANLARGAGWWSDIQGHSYLGDHVEPILLLLVPLFRLWPDARLLIIVQALVLGLSAVPVYVLLRTTLPLSASSGRGGAGGGEGVLRGVTIHRLSPPSPPSPHSREGGDRISTPLLLTVLYLLNPLLWNAALFEFHALAFAPLFLLSAAVAYQRRRFGWFVVFLLLACAVREDTGLIVGMFGLVEVVRWWRTRRLNVECRMSNVESISNDQRSNDGVRGARMSFFGIRPWSFIPSFVIRHSLFMLWAVVPLLLGLTWFFIATRTVASSNPGGSYPFLVYYGWLGGSFGEVLVNAVVHPFIVLRHLLRLPNMDFALGLLLPFLFLPLLTPRWLLLALPPLAQILLSAGGGSNLIVEMHYGLLFLPALTLAAGAAISNVRRPTHRLAFVARVIPLSRHTAITLAMGTALAAAWFLGPFRGIATAVVFGAIPEERARAGAIREALDAIPDDAVVSTTAASLTTLAARPGTTYLPNVALGQQQYAVAPYALPDATTHLVVSAQELREDLAAFASISWSAPHARDAAQRLRAVLDARGFRVTARHGDVYTFSRDAGGEEPPSSFFAAPHRHAYRILNPLRDLRAVWE